MTGQNPYGVMPRPVGKIEDSQLSGCSAFTGLSALSLDRSPVGTTLMRRVILSRRMTEQESEGSSSPRSGGMGKSLSVVAVLLAAIALVLSVAIPGPAGLTGETGQQGPAGAQGPAGP